MLVRGVIGHKIDDDLEAALVGLSDKGIESLQVTEDGINTAVVGNVVAKVGHWRGIEGRDPHGIHAKPGQVVKLVYDALQISDAITIAVFETAGVNLINHA